MVAEYSEHDTHNGDSDKRLALVISNSTYKSKTLIKTHNDAVDMSAQLHLMGFEVVLRENLGKVKMENAVANFTRKLKNFGRWVVLFCLTRLYG